jgi:hypothetical protein
MRDYGCCHLVNNNFGGIEAGQAESQFTGPADEIRVFSQHPDGPGQGLSRQFLFQHQEAGVLFEQRLGVFPLVVINRMGKRNEQACLAAGGYFGDSCRSGAADD